MKTLGVIPARYGSTRLNGKPLLDICGHKMIEWVYRRAMKSSLDKIIVATDNEDIFNEVKRFGGDAIMTSDNHNTGTDRIVEAVQNYEKYSIIINIQGDEPLIEPKLIDELIEAFKDKSVNMATFKHKIENKSEINNPNVVKVITDLDNNAIYFSRSVIPYNRNNNSIINYYRHIGIYGYRRDFLFTYASLKKSKLEEAESLEQLRAIENGYDIKVLETDYNVKGVDTKEDLEDIIEYIKNNNIVI